MVAEEDVRRAGARRGLAPRLTGAQVARAILDANGLHEVPVHVSPGGPLSDHYDPKKRSVHLSHPVYDEVSISATAVGAHEVGHAIQHKEAYSFFRFRRSALFPAVAFSSSIWIWLLMAGFLLQLTGLFLVAIVLYAVVVLFQFITLPVEFDASKRAAVQLQAVGLTATQETGGVKKVLNAAALAYVRGRAGRPDAAPLLRPALPGQPRLIGFGRKAEAAGRLERRAALGAEQQARERPRLLRSASLTLTTAIGYSTSACAGSSMTPDGVARGKRVRVVDERGLGGARDDLIGQRQG